MKIKVKKRNIFITLFITTILILFPNNVFAATHDFSLQASDFDVTANDWEGAGTEDPINNGDYVEPGQVFKVDIYYVPGDTKVTGMQVGINYDPNVLTPIYELDDNGLPSALYVEADMSTTAQGGIWPPKGNTASQKKQTNWQVQGNDDTDVNMIKLLISDSQVAKPLENEGIIATVYFKVKDSAAAGAVINLDIDSSYTKVTGSYAKTVSSLSFTVYGAMSQDVSLKELTFTGNNGVLYSSDPIFSAGTTSRTFSVIVPNNVSSINISATATDSLAKILSGGVGLKNLSVGNNSFNLVVQAQNGNQEIYLIKIKRLSNDASLKTLSLSGITLDYELSSSLFTYTSTIPYATKETTVNATTTDSNAKITSGTGSWSLTNYGTDINTKKIIVEAEDCKDEYSTVPSNSCTQQEYTLNITRIAPSSDTTLSSLKIDGILIEDFNPAKTEYTLTDQANSKKLINIVATANDSKATVAGNGSKSLNVGDNTFTIVVTAEDQKTQTYTIKVRRLSNNANLSSLSVTSTPQGVLSPSFTPNFYNYYTYTYDSTVTDINIAATLEDNNATIVSGTGTYSSSDTEANIVVTAEDGSTKTYIVKFSRNKSSDNNLKSLSIDGYNLNENFSPSTTLYTATVPGTVSSINVNAVANDSKATITTGTGTHNLNYGQNTIQIRVKAENGAEKDYTITVTRSKKTISALSDLTVDGITVANFKEDTLTYDIGTVPFSTEKITIGATAKDSDATITGVGEVSLKTGDNEFKIISTAQDGKTKTTYIIKVNRTKSNNTYLKNLTLKEKTFSFVKTRKTYDVEVPYTVTTATITATPEYADATSSISGPSFLSVGTNTYTITVTAEDGTIDTYTLNITRKQSTNVYLSNLTATNNGTNYLGAFNKKTENYNITVPNEIDNIDINTTLEEPTNQTVTGDGNKSLKTGTNKFEIVVTAASGDTKTYTINIIRSLNSNNNLSSLVVADQTLTPTFSPNITSYNVTVESDVSNIMISATPEVSTSQVTGVGSKSLKTGTNTFNIDVEAEDKTVKTYVIVVTKKASNDSSLSSLSINETPLNETFNKVITNYTANVANNVEQVTINATATDSKVKSITGTGVVKLKTGDNTINIVVTAEDNTQTTYTIIINRAKSMNANLKSLTLSGGYTFNEEFNKNTTSYTVTVPNSVSQILISAEKEDDLATVTGTGQVKLSSGTNNFEVTVTAEDNSVKKVYKIEIYRQLSNNAYLKSLQSINGLITPTFDKTNNDYNLTVPYEITEPNITAEAEDENASVSINGNKNLEVGTNNISIIVTAEDGTINTYNLVITRQPSSNNYLSNIEVIDKNNKNYISVFNKETIKYEINVANDIDTITLKATAEDGATTIKGLGDKKLSVGENSFTISSVSANGVSRNYIINIERAKNSNTKLKELTVEGYTLVPDFNSDTYSYSLNVDASVDEINIIATAEEKTTNINGSGKKQLKTGLNTFNIDVEAEDGSTKTYVIVINKAASSNNYLASLLLDQPFTPSFDRETLNYSATVSNTTTTVNVTGVAEDPNATVEGNGIQNLAVGHNTITITVTAENNTFRAYTIDVYREASSNNYLSDLKVNGTTVDLFNREKTSYSLTVENDVTQADVTAILEDETATVTGDKITYLSTGLNTINVVVTAQNGTTKIYTIEITRKKSSNNYLAILSSLEGVLSPSFTKENTDYTMQVPYEITSLTLTTVVEDANAVVGVEGNSDFTIGDNNIVYIPVTAEDGSTKTYQIKVTRLPQANNFLSNLTVTSTTNGKTYELNPSFNKNTLNYTISINEDDNKLTISGDKEAVSSTVTGLEDIEVTTFPYNHQVVVKSAGGVDRTYNITINKIKSSNANLKSISVSEGNLTPEFNENTLSYTVNVDSNVSSIDIIAGLNKAQTIVGDGVHNLNYGDNMISLAVTAEDGTTKTYTINVIRNQEINTELDDIEVVNGTLSPTFTKQVVDYIAYVGEDAKDITITPKVSDILATISISLNNSEYQNINSITITDLSIENNIKIKVEGKDKTTIYTVAILNQSTEKITSEKYGHDIRDGMIKTVKIDTSPTELKDQLDNDNSKLKIYLSDGTTEYKGDKIGTGMIIKLFKDDSVIDQKIIVVKGDIDGNGIINAIDSLKVVNHIIENEILTGCYKEAADTTNDSVINAIDALKIVNHIIGTISLY